MKCINCGMILKDDATVCNYCGHQFVEKKGYPTRNKVFAFIGYGHSILGLIVCIIPYLCYMSFIYSVIGLIFSNMGIESTKVSYAKKGKKMSIIALILGLVMSILTVLLNDFGIL